MDSYYKARRTGCAVVLCALLFRLFAAGLPQALLHRFLPPLKQPQKKETGQDVRSFDSSVFNYLPESHAPDSLPELSPEPELLPVFAPADLLTLQVQDTCQAKPDLETLIARPLSLHLCETEPTVLILHTHTTESYQKMQEDYSETVPYRTLSEQYNMLSIGDAAAALLEENGVRVLHDRTLHDYPSYTAAYSHARKAIRSFLQEYPSIQLVLDIHRDAMEDKKGHQLAVRTETADGTAAQLMIVMGTGNAGVSNPYWLENLSLGLKLTAALERVSPGITRPVQLRSQKFNQDLAANMLLVEIGAAGNTHEEAVRAAQLLAQGILLLKNGTLPPE